MNVTLVGKNLCRYNRGHSGLGQALNPVTGDLLGRETESRQTQREGHVKTEAEFGVMGPQTKEHLGKLEETRKDSPPTPAPLEGELELGSRLPTSGLGSCFLLNPDLTLPASRTVRE